MKSTNANSSPACRRCLQFIIFVGSPTGRKNINPQDYLGVCTRVGALIDDFSVVRAERCNRSQFEDSLVIHTSTQDPRKAFDAAISILSFLGQDAISLAHDGIAIQINHSTDPEDCFESFGLTN